jgi:AcrR family transcriptional regulator
MPAERERAARRRSSGEPRDLLLEAARREFAANGYPGTTTRDVARSAGVALSAVHKNFASKADLFAEAVLEPFVDAFEQLGKDWLRQLAMPLSDEKLMEVFVRDMLASVEGQSHALEQLMLGPAELSDATTRRIREVFEQLFNQLQLMTELEAGRRGWFSPEKVEDTLRVLVGMILGTSAFGWFLFPQGAADAGSARVRKAMVEVGLWGVARRPPS